MNQSIYMFYHSTDHSLNIEYQDDEEFIVIPGKIYFHSFDKKIINLLFLKGMKFSQQQTENFFFLYIDLKSLKKIIDVLYIMKKPLKFCDNTSIFTSYEEITEKKFLEIMKKYIRNTNLKKRIDKNVKCG